VKLGRDKFITCPSEKDDIEDKMGRELLKYLAIILIIFTPQFITYILASIFGQF
jgi:hypothetical protein